MNYDDIMRLALERGFYAPSCEIYSDTFAGFWDYGPLGSIFRNRFVQLWRQNIVRRSGMFEIDGSQIMSKSVFVASGHLENFVDPVVSCSKCDTRIRADKLIQDKKGVIIPERLKNEEYDIILKENDIKCPKCGGSLENTSKFNMMFKVEVGAVGEEAYLRPETCQSIFVNFSRLFKIMRGKLPFAVAQFGKSFRNEISPRQSLMRLREFYQAEAEIFFNPINVNNFEMFSDIENSVLRLLINDQIREITCSNAIEENLIPNKMIAYYLAIIQQFYEIVGIDRESIRFRKLGEDEKAFYATTAFDLEVKTTLGWIELVACNDRGNYDLKRHSEISKKELTVTDNDEKVLPHVFELSMGVDRSLYCILEHSFVKEEGRDLLKIKRSLASIQVGVFPLINKEGLPSKAREVYNVLKNEFDVIYDDSGSIGRRYRRLDEIGVPLVVTIDHDTLKDNLVTLRDRDSMKQIKIKIEDILGRIRSYYLGEDLFN